MRWMISKSMSCAICMEMYVVLLSSCYVQQACREVALSKDEIADAPGPI